jgi:hypothetical protein
MSRSPISRLCTQCRARQTRSATRVCWECRPAPAVRRDGGYIHIEGLGNLTTHAALRLAHALADAVQP